jgi:hypothetical protein
MQTGKMPAAFRWWIAIDNSHPLVLTTTHLWRVVPEHLDFRTNRETTSLVALPHLILRLYRREKRPHELESPCLICLSRRSRKTFQFAKTSS